MKTYFALILAFLCLAAPTQAEVIYSNTHLNYINPFLPYLLPSGSDFTVGDLVTLGGSSRHVTDFTAGFFATLLDSNGNPIQSFTVELSLYFYQVGPENQVGPQIGSRITRTAVVLDDGSFNPITLSGLFAFTFSGLNVDLPNSFIWAVRVKQGADGAVR